MRISKDPEERKHEILHTAIKLFCSKGYERTSISDIAREMHVSQGLCYRYFPSKEAIYQATIDEYANFLMSEAMKEYDFKGKPLTERIRAMSGNMSGYTQIEQQMPEMYELFHKEAHSQIHDQLFFAMSEKLVPFVQKNLQTANENGEIHITDVETVAYFVVYGQIGILRRDDLSAKEKMERIQESLFELLNLN